MTKKKNPVTCVLKEGMRVSMRPGHHFGPLKHGVHVRRLSGGASFIVRWDGEAHDSYYYRYELLADLTPTEPEEYEAFFV